jgi:putative membrane protein
LAEVPVAVGEIPKWAQGILKPADLTQIQEAVRQAELRTEGEIVPVIVRSSTPVGGVRVACVLFFVALFGLLDFYYLRDQGGAVFAGSMLLALALGLVLARFEGVQRFVLPDADEIASVHNRAELEFYRQKVYATSEHIGILIFISLLERQAVILADEKIAKELPEKIWQETLHHLLGDIRHGRWAKGMTQAIASCADLAAAKFPKRGDSANELSNELILKD